MFVSLLEHWQVVIPGGLCGSKTVKDKGRYGTIVTPFTVIAYGTTVVLLTQTLLTKLFELS